MKEIILIDDIISKAGIEEVEYFGDDLDAAIGEAQCRWEALTKNDKLRRDNFLVATAEVEYDEELEGKYYGDIIEVHRDFLKEFLNEL